MSKRHQITPVVYLFLYNNDGQILLCNRINTDFYDGYFSVPSGHLEGNETMTQAIVREAKEEIGINLSKDDLTFIHTSNRKSIHDERVDYYFKADCKSHKPKIMEPNKCDKMDWYDMNKLPDDIIPYVKEVLKMIEKISSTVN